MSEHGYPAHTTDGGPFLPTKCGARSAGPGSGGAGSGETGVMRGGTREDGDEMIAALYVAAGGAYFGLDSVDPWDQARDARSYNGPFPVVAHPPCHLWVNFAALNYKRYGGEHNRPGNDGGCFAAALDSVRKWGGVLEHPASSNAWPAHGLPRPDGIGWQQGAGGWVCEVWQSAYGHKARKRTWLYAVSEHAPPELDWSRKPGEAQVGWFDRNKPTLSKKAASATPPAFRDALIGIARAARMGTR